MGKSSSSSSDSSDYEWKHLNKHEKKQMKKWKKKMKKGKIPYGTPPPIAISGYAGPHFAGKHGKHGKHGYPPGAYPPPGGYPAGAVPPMGYGVQPPPAGYAQPPAGYPAPQAGYPPPAGYPAQTAGYPAQPGGYPAPPAGYPAPPGAGYTPGGFQGAGVPQHGPVYPAGQAPPPGQYPTKEDCPEHHPDTEVPEFQQEPEDEGTEADNEEEHVEEEDPVSVAGEEEEEDVHHEHSGGEEEKDKHKKKHKDTDTDDGEGTVTLDGHAEDFTPAVVDAEGFSAEKDAEALRQAMRGAGTNEQSLIDIVGHRSANQRQEIEITYKTMFGKDLLDDIESELSGEFRELMMGLFKPPAYYDAWCLHEAMVGAGTKDNILIEILCTRTNDQIAAIASTYKEQFGCELEQDITDDTSGEFKRLMVSSCQGHRSELSPDQLDQVRSEGWESVIDHDQATEDAQRLYDAGENRLGTDESTFLQILAMRNYYQLRGIFEEYEKIAGCDLLESISSEMSGNFEDGLRALVRSARNRPEYFADKLHNALSGLGTKDTRLIRIIISRSEIDLKDIQQAFLDKYEQDLAAMIDSDTSGDYKQLLLAIINN